MATIDSGTLSALILQIYAASRIGDVLEFQRRAMESVARCIRFDAAWWGRGTVAAGEHRVHGSFPYRMPADVAERFNLTDRDNVVARKVVSQPGRAHYFSRADRFSQPSTRALTEHMEIAQSICISDLEGRTGITNFVSLARRRAVPRFSGRDLRLVELLAPHLSAALQMALADQLAAQRNPEKSALLAADALGSLRVIENGAMDLLRLEWPGWVGPVLPAPLVACLAARQAEHLGREVRVSIRWSGDHAFLSLRRREPSDMLTRQERAVARAFASGLSYRQVADDLGLAPATVRHHLRSAYVKLGVSDKAAFATRLGHG
jgi:DNA-binding CsgD family transcriptional regulator